MGGLLNAVDGIYERILVRRPDRGAGDELASRREPITTD